MRLFLMEEEVPQLAIATAINVTRITTANEFFFIAQSFLVYR
jgi:hypothetical protein